jgi:hypothetical protein
VYVTTPPQASPRPPQARKFWADNAQYTIFARFFASHTRGQSGSSVPSSLLRSENTRLLQLPPWHSDRQTRA